MIKRIGRLTYEFGLPIKPRITDLQLSSHLGKEDRIEKKSQLKGSLLTETEIMALEDGA